MIKEKLIKLFEDPDWRGQISDFYPRWKVEILWNMVDFVREGKYLEEAMFIAESFVDDPDPTIDDSTNQEILKGEDARAIVTVRGTLAWLLNVIVGTLNASYYSRVISLLEKLCIDDAVYVRQQATYPLAGLTLNLRAERNPDGSVFPFSVADKERVRGLAFLMLEQNKQYPRVLELLANVFEKLRLLDEQKALYVLKSFLYKPEGGFNPDYVTHEIAPLLIFFAEFRRDHEPGFNSAEFETLLMTVIESASPRLKTTIVWHIWKTIENDPKTYPRLRKYIPIFFKGEFEEEPLSQYEFLIEKILLQSPTDAVEVFKMEIDYLKRALYKKPFQENWTLWFHNPESIVEAVAENDPGSLLGILDVLKEISLRHGYIGDVTKVFSSFRKAPAELQEQLSTEITPMYETLRAVMPNLPPL